MRYGGKGASVQGSFLSVRSARGAFRVIEIAFPSALSCPDAEEEPAAARKAAVRKRVECGMGRIPRKPPVKRPPSGKKPPDTRPGYPAAFVTVAS